MSAEDKTPPRNYGRFVGRAAVAIVIVLVGVLVARRIYETRPQPKRRPPLRVAPTVEVITAVQTNARVHVESHGEVIPARALMLAPRVSGQIVSVHKNFFEGGMIPAGEPIIQIDPTDFELTVTRAASAVAVAELQVAQETGAGEIARRERELLDDTDEGLSRLQESLVLREPQRVAAEARLKAAQADLKQAELNVERTSLTAPFDVIVRERMVELGGQASPQTPVASLVDAETYWVRASIPLGMVIHARYQPPAGGGAHALVHSPSGFEGQGRVIGLEPDVDPRGRMAGILVAIDRPAEQADGDAPLLLGDFVDVTIEGEVLESVIPMPRYALHEGDRVWVATPEGTLAVRDVDVAWSERETVYLSDGVADGERVITTPLSAPIQGIEIRIEGPEGSDPGTVEQKPAGDGEGRERE